MYEWSRVIFAKKSKFHDAGGPDTVVSPKYNVATAAVPAPGDTAASNNGDGSNRRAQSSLYYCPLCLVGSSGPGCDNVASTQPCTCTMSMPPHYDSSAYINIIFGYKLLLLSLSIC